MSEAMTALVAAAAALAGSGVTGFFGILAARRQADAAWNAALRQADVAWGAALRQADAQLQVMRESLRDQAAAVQRGVRRTAYANFLSQAHRARQTVSAWAAAPTSTALRNVRDTALDSLDEALNVVRLEGPDEVVAAAEAMATALADPSQAHFPSQAEFLLRATNALSPGS